MENISKKLNEVGRKCGADGGRSTTEGSRWLGIAK